MAKPTNTEYRKAKEDIQSISYWLSLEKERLEKLLDDVCNSRKLIKGYQNLLNEKRYIVDKYEVYEELEKEKENA